ncbi:MAG: adenylate kinase family protein [Patescibacteria group bacterium UBA2103]
MDNTFIFTGRPGAGKGTQAKLLAKKLDAQFYSAGAELRAFAKQDTLPARQVKEDIDNGLLVPYGMMVHIFYSILLKLSEEDTVVLDGFARRLIEAQMMCRAFNWMHRPFTVINLEIPDEVVRERIKARSAKEDRGDEESVENRLSEYEEHTAHSIEFFREHGKVVDIDGTQTIEEIEKEVWEKIQ